MSPLARSLDPSDLIIALETSCTVHGLPSGETAAVHLLTTNQKWLRRAEVRDRIDVDDGEQLTAWIDWAEVAIRCDSSPASSGEVALLRLACHLAGYLPQSVHPDWSLDSILTSLDAPNRLLASRAVAMGALGRDIVPTLR